LADRRAVGQFICAARWRVAWLRGRQSLCAGHRADGDALTVIATGFDRESVAVGTVAGAEALPATQPRYTPTRGTDELPNRTAVGQVRNDDLDVPAFIRKKAD